RYQLLPRGSGDGSLERAARRAPFRRRRTGAADRWRDGCETAAAPCGGRAPRPPSSFQQPVARRQRGASAAATSLVRGYRLVVLRWHGRLVVAVRRVLTFAAKLLFLLRLPVELLSALLEIVVGLSSQM